MSQENIDAVRAVYERWSQGDFFATVDLLDQHVVMVLGSHFSWGAPEGISLFGADAVVAYTREDILRPMARLTMEAEGLVSAGDSVVADVYQRGVGKTSGVPTEMRFFTVWSFRGGKVIRIESFSDRIAALEAVGLSERALASD